MAGASDPQSHTPQTPGSGAAGDQPIAGVESAHSVAVAEGFEGAEGLGGSVPSVHADAVARLAGARAALAEALAAIPVGLLSDAEAVTALKEVEAIGRTVDAARVSTATDVDRRARVLGREGLAWRMGCTGPWDVLTRVTRVSAREVKRRTKLGDAVLPRPCGGSSWLPPLFPTVGAALTAGQIGVETAELIVAGLQVISHRVAPDNLLTAERALVATAAGLITPETEDLAGAGVPVTTDLIRGMVAQWQAALDPDGVLPTEDLFEAKSNIGFGQLKNGLYPVKGGVTPELFGIMNAMFDAFLSFHARPAFPTAEEQALMDSGQMIPGAESAGTDADTGPDLDVIEAELRERRADTRTSGEKRADILRALFEHAARDTDTPSMGGSAPTVMVHVNAADLASGVGVGWIDGVEAPVSLKTVHQRICDGGFQGVLFGANNEVLKLGPERRYFNRAQRRAITARDGGCIIPGCKAPAHWAEVHHVKPWAKDGPTTVDNGVLLCWFHHHTIDTSGWEIRMVKGSPQVRAPGLIDPQRLWRPPNRHRAHQVLTGPPNRD
ncbi:MULTISPECIES: HNH endonuclease signature motif containing protein [unclassified Cryobacterium]|uniref:HNH endonuclease signature motif containing protein n=1 Tax=unclassified Cryobacterium TaxID=2649013 RepID=UPI00106C15CF|nr:MULTISPECIES: HNH endonuclease signature motif containing protein [unclassified Cryobacterium]TFB95826.1 HNH endonuclease [Cryobacterium sp. MDB2-A-1]TFC12139.1 HNH endonuclease [Cryobacterium sp. MDB2-A-2]